VGWKGKVQIKKNISILLLWVMFIGCLKARPEKNTAADKEQCLAQLRSIGNAIKLFREDNEGKFPKDLKEAISESSTDDKIIRCPALSGIESGLQFINWSSVLKGEIPSEFPMVFDSKLKNHRSGLNVLTVDGKSFWDEGGQYIKKFLKEHREYSDYFPGIKP
jgi:hypothetical protein